MKIAARDRNNVEASSRALARNALLITAVLAAAGCALGLVAFAHGSLSPVEATLVVSSFVFSLAVLGTLLVFRRIQVELVAAASTVYYMVYLLACIAVTVRAPGENENLFIYLLWFFPLLVFNRLVNLPRVARSLAHLLMFAPLAALAALAPRLKSDLSPESLYHIAAFCLSYLCFGLMLNVVTRFREAYIVARERADSLRMESAILESISDCFISIDSEWRLVYLNDAACAEFSITRHDALHNRIPEILPGFFNPSVMAELRPALGSTAATQFEIQVDSEDRWYELRCFPRPGSLSVYFRNITSSMLARRQLENANTQLRERSDLLDRAQDAVFVQDMQTRIRYWNKGAERLFGWTAEEVIGKAAGDVFVSDRLQLKEAFHRVVNLGDWSGEISKRDKAGRRLVVESRCNPVHSPDGQPRAILVINTDITERKASQAKIQHQAHYDSLTALPNRFLLREHLGNALARAERSRELGALFLIDLDDFKSLNDTLGHDTGDLLLQQIARRLQSAVRAKDSVARFGGDEFVVALGGLGSDPKLAAAKARAVGKDILRIFRHTFRLGSYEYHGSASIGITLFHGLADDLDQLLKRADLAMYCAKSHGRDTVCSFDPAMEKCAASRAALQHDLRRAIRNGDFRLYYQPQLDIGGRLFAAEALLRWPHSERGMIPPNQFIPLAEETGLIVELGKWALFEVSKQLAEWERLPQLAGLRIAVNVSNRQLLDPDFVRIVEQAIAQSGTGPECLELEITESTAMERPNETIAKMTALKALGVSFSLDDFGTGYSSLSQLRRLPLDQVKIDQSFIRGALNSQTDASIVRTIMDLGRNLGLHVIAEGVETEQQFQFLQNLGCFGYQGYLFSPAVPPADFVAWVLAGNRGTEPESNRHCCLA